MALGLGLLPVRAHAHALNMTRLAVTFAADATFTAALEVDLVILLGGGPAYRELVASPTVAADRMPALANTLLRNLQFEFDGHAVAVDLVEWRLPEVAPEAFDDDAVSKMTTFNFRGAVPRDATTFQVKSGVMFPAEFPLALTLVAPAQGVSMTRWLELGGQASRPFALAGVVTEVAATPREPAPPLSALDRRLLEMQPWQKAFVTRLLTGGEFLRLGFLHIVPRGWDHVLFVLGLFFLGANWRTLAWQTSFFTVAHTTTLGLAAAGLVRVSPALVEPLIAFSIAFVAAENIVCPRLGPGRLAAVFAFGLLHGLGFAGSLSEVRLPAEEFFTALLAFNFGVDFGQLAVLALAFGLVGWWRERNWYRSRVVIPNCAAIAAVGLFWTVERIVG